MPVPSLCHDLGNHLSLNLVVADSLHFLPFLVEGVVGDHLDVALDLLYGGKGYISKKKQRINYSSDDISD